MVMNKDFDLIEEQPQNQPTPIVPQPVTAGSPSQPAPAPAPTSGPAAAVPNYDPGSIQALIIQIADELGVKRETALAAAQKESGFNPTAEGDLTNGRYTSFGIYQLHEGGELGNLTREQAFDPATNIRIALTEMAAVQRAHPDWTSGQVAAGAQRPADAAGYARDVDAIVSGGISAAAVPYAGGASVSVSGVPASSVQSDQGLTAEEYFRKNYGYEAWLLDIPEVKDALLPLLDQRADAGKIQAAIEGTDWWRTHSITQRQFLDNEMRDPAQAKQQVAAAQAQIEMAAQRAGVTIAPDRLAAMARDAAQFGWDGNQVTLAVQHETNAAPISGGLIDASSMQVKALGAKYFMPVDDATAMSWGRNIANGTASLQGFAQWASKQAAASRPELAPQLAQGLTMDDIFSTHRQQIANTLEMDPNSVDFVNNPRWQKVMDYVPPGETQRRAMTIPETLSYARSQPEYRTTKQANDQADSAALNLAIKFGKVAQ